MIPISIGTRVFEVRVYQNKLIDIFSAMGLVSLNEKQSYTFMRDYLMGFINRYQSNPMVDWEDFNNRVRNFLAEIFPE